MALIQSEPQSIKIWTTDVTAVYLWDTQVRPVIIPSVLDEVTGTGASNLNYANYYYFWICITPKVVCNLVRVKFYWDWVRTWTLKVSQWNYASSTTWVQTYSLTSTTPVQEFELDTPYQMSAGTKYCISYISTYSQERCRTDSWISMPVSWTNVTIEYSTTSQSNGQYSSVIRWVSWVYTSVI